jgi:hypothetical protein
MLDSTTAPTEQNKEVDMIVAGFIGAFRKRGFDQQHIGILMTAAFLLSLEEVEKRIDAVLSCAEEGNEESCRKLCAYLAQQGVLFSTEDTDPCEIIEILKNAYGKEAAFETLLTFPKLLLVWKRADVRDDERYIEEKTRADIILHEVSSTFPVVG